ncbi:MAG: exopolysaccharide biosynthesis polyprenyl glycosylphosphotransferase, partial [Muribaculaceae bacterium]|nr:exopolysaccharide biosynthesis polyprenyl glycosylphosphotransferase [Muribaculaceae bacterium]
MNDSGRNLLRLCYVLGDYLMLNVGWLLFNIVRFHSLPVGWEGPMAEFLESTPVLVGQLVIPLAVVAMYAVSGYYTSEIGKSRVDDLLNTVSVSAISATIIFFAVLINDDIPERLLNYQILLILWLLLMMPVYICRYMITSVCRHRLEAGNLRIPVAVIGDSVRARSLAERIKRIPVSMGYDIRTVVEHDDSAGIDRVARDVEAGIIRVVILACGKADGVDTSRLIGRFVQMQCSVYIEPDIYDMLTMRTRMHSVSHEPLINVTQGLSPATANLKRLGDIVVSAISLVALMPVFAAIAVAIKRDSRGPVFYSQERVGFRNRPFRIHKFRTMRPDAEADGPQLSSENDSRITRVGAVLRKYRLDELPQFWNVLVGEMSLVGPRPEREYYLRQIAERAPYVSLTHLVRPG